MRAWMPLVLCGAALAGAHAQVNTQTLDYQDGDVTLEAYLDLPESRSDRFPTVLVVHDKDGIDRYAQMRAKELAKLGYMALAIDIHDKGVRPNNAQQSAAEAGKYYRDPALYYSRLQAVLDFTRSFEFVDPDKMVAIGYCFGGTCVLEMARQGMELAGVASFHGNLSTQSPAVEGKFKGKVAVYHAIEDPVVPRNEFHAFLDEFNTAKLDYQVLVFNLRAHAFTKIGGEQYSADADRRSWNHLKGFLAEVFGETQSTSS